MSDFSNVQDIAGNFTTSGTEEATLFVNVGDGGYITVESVGFGEGGFGEGGFGGYDITFAVNSVTTWTNVDTP